MPAPGARMVAEMQRFAQSSLHCSGTVFYWIDDAMRMEDTSLTGVPAAPFARYKAGLHRLDPLNVPRMSRQGHRVATLAGAGNLVTAGELAEYTGFLRESEIMDVMDLLFWQDGLAVAGLGVFKKPGDAPLTPDSIALAQAMHPYLEFNLASHPRLRQRRLRRRLMGAHGLTARELEVIVLVRRGCTNMDIAEELDLALATVKTHLLRIFEKLGVESRTGLCSVVAALETEQPAAA